MKALGRNDPCHCGSGKKYKHCCLAKDEATEREARAKAASEAPPPPPEAQKSAPSASAGRHTTQQPWKRANTRGFQKLNIPRRSGGS